MVENRWFCTVNDVVFPAMTRNIPSAIARAVSGCSSSALARSETVAVKCFKLLILIWIFRFIEWCPDMIGRSAGASIVSPFDVVGALMVAKTWCHRGSARWFGLRHEKIRITDVLNKKSLIGRARELRWNPHMRNREQGVCGTGWAMDSCSALF